MLKRFFFLLFCACFLFVGNTSFTTQQSEQDHTVFIRIFKYEEILEVWEQSAKDLPFIKTQTIKVCAASGKLGPKRAQGDFQVPEGFYKVTHFNPNSKYHLSLRLNYPNQSDRKRTSNPANPGGDIMIHGACASIGCVSIGNENIEYLYNLLETYKAQGQAVLPVHIFPCKMNALRYDVLKYLKRKDKMLLSFWKELEEGFHYFNEKKRVPSINISPTGVYQVNEEQPLL